MRGYIKLYRQIAENPIWLIKPFSEGQAWIDLLCLSTFDKGFIKTKNGQIIELKKGDCGYSMLSLANRWGWSRGKVKRFFELLIRQQMIQQKTYGKYTIINILNYSKYQNDTTNKTTNDTTNGQQMIQQTDTINNDKNVKNDKNVINSFINSEKIKKLDPYINNSVIEKYKSEHERVFGNRLRLDAQQRQKVMELNADIEDFVNTIPEVFERAKNITFDIPNFNPNGVWLLRDSNYTNVLNGLYDKRTDKFHDEWYEKTKAELAAKGYK